MLRVRDNRGVCGLRDAPRGSTMRRVEAAVFVALGLAAGAVQAQSPAPESRAIADAIQAVLDGPGDGPLRVEGALIAARTPVEEFYTARRFEPAWSAADVRAELQEAIDGSAAHGLDPGDYHRNEIAAVQRRSAGGAGAEDVARVDILLTDAAFRLAYHLLFGKVDPARIDTNWNFSRELPDVDPAERLENALTSGDLRARLEALSPQHPLYRALQLALAQYREIAARGGWPAVPDGPTLRQGDSGARVASLRRRLAASGDLDSSDVSREEFDATLAAAVGRFQERHGLDPDSAVGPGTLRALNVPVEQRIDALRVNLERARWVLHDLDPEFVVVNVAGFEAYWVEGGAITWESRVQVGKVVRQTPIFRDEIQYLVLNPTWTVPPGILANDILPAARRDPAAVTRKGLEVLDGAGRKIDPANVDWSRYSASSLPYTLRQPAGPANALGRIKFMFPNPHLVYLHDTPSRGLFSEARRDFSSGCIRVEKPLELAERLLDDPAWTEATLQAAIDRGTTRTLHLKRPVPVLLMYWTAGIVGAVATPGPADVAFYPDIYNRDAAVRRSLDAPFRFR